MLSLLNTHGCYGLGAHVWRARQTVGLLRGRLVSSLLAGYATVLGRVQVRTRHADGQRALFNAGSAGLLGGPAGGTLLTSRFDTLGPVCSPWTRFAFSFDSQVHTVRTFVSAFL